MQRVNDNNSNHHNHHCIERCKSRFLQSCHNTTNCLQHIQLSGKGAVECKSRATHRALVTCNMSCATGYEGTAAVVDPSQIKQVHLLLRISEAVLLFSFPIHFLPCFFAFHCSLFLLSFSLAGPVTTILSIALSNQYYVPKSVIYTAKSHQCGQSYTVIFDLLSTLVYKLHPLNLSKILILSTNKPHWFISRTYDTHE